MSAHRDFLLVKYTVQGTPFVIPTTIHIPSPSEWFQQNREALLRELQEELIQRHGRIVNAGEEDPQFEFLSTPRMKVIFLAEKSRMRHALIMKGESCSSLRGHDCELVTWLYPVEADIPVDFIRI